MTLKIRILRCSRRLFIILVSLTVTLFSEKMLIFTRCIRGFMSNLIKKSLTVSNGNAVGKSCGQRGTEASEPVICCHWAIFWLALWSLLNKFISMAGTAANSFKAAGCVNCHTRGSQLTRKARMLFIAYRIVASRSTSWLVTCLGL